jgi:succinate-semialdehyde dehydrogenase/glutarate-semialdehyde dehydrogenase
MQLQDGGLFRDQALIDGIWTVADSGARFEVANPATGTPLANVPDMGAAETRRAIQAAEVALPAWRARTGKERAMLLRRWHDLIMAHADDLAMIMTSEQGKPLPEAKLEVTTGAGYVEWFAEEARRVYGETIPSPVGDKRIVVLKQPVGVCAAITPWNFPLAMITRKVAPALAAGCTVVAKPAEQTPLTACALAELAQRAGFPAGVFNVVTASAESAAQVGGELTANPVVRKISFTGSTEVGRWLMAHSADTVKRLSLELGGNAPFIVFDDADIDAAVNGAVASRYRNAGQTCICANRLLVHERIYDRFCARLAEVVGRFKVGNGLEEGNFIGPLIDAAALAKVEAIVGDAVAGGARVLVGGKRHALGRSFFEPTVLADVQPGMRCIREEIFGPVAPVLKFSSEDEAIALANATEYGLAGYFYARDVARVWRVAEALEVGMVGINTIVISNEAAPFGGIKQSGIGREGSRHGIEEYLQMKYLCLGL